MTNDSHLHAITRLITIMDRLRSPGGCPWDAEQTPESLIPYLLEETHETIEAIELGDPAEIRDELGDLLLQIVFHSRIFAERGAFDIGDVATAISDKLVRRHPHVFTPDQPRPEADAATQWEAIKYAEKARQGKPRPSLTESLPKTLPALQRAQKLVEKSARQGREWPTGPEACAAAQQHLDDVAADTTDARFGDLLFSLVLCARAAGIDAEGALRRATHRILAETDPKS